MRNYLSRLGTKAGNTALVPGAAVFVNQGATVVESWALGSSCPKRRDGGNEDQTPAQVCRRHSLGRDDPRALAGVSGIRTGRDINLAERPRSGRQQLRRHGLREWLPSNRYR